MQKIVIEKPYKFVPPHRGNWWPSFIQQFDLIGLYLRRSHGIVEHECRRVELLKESLAAGHGIMLTPNHARPADPIVMGFLARQAGTHVYAMASWHLFNQDRFTAWAIRKMGGFSVYREGMDRQAIDTAIDALRTAERPLILFPEGSVTRTNDVLHGMLDGVSFIAHTAARRRERDFPGGKVVVHPVALKYLFQGDLEAVITPVLAEIETRLTWNPQRHLSLVERIYKVGMALLVLKEIQYLGRPQNGTLAERLNQLINRLLVPLEEEWLDGPRDGAVVPRVKNLRMAILPAMIRGEVDEAERERRWRQLADIYLSQQLSCYIPDYIVTSLSVDRLLETVERYEEDITDVVRVHGSLKVIIEVSEAIEVPAHRDRKATTDPLMKEIESRLAQMLQRLAGESRVYQGPLLTPPQPMATAG